MTHKIIGKALIPIKTVKPHKNQERNNSGQIRT